MDNILQLYNDNSFNEIEKKYNINFEDKELLLKAFTHGSFNLFNLENYQRLEFLGDAILQMVVSDYMYRIDSKESEGNMSKKRGAIVSEFSLAYVVRKEGLDKYILFGNSLKQNEVKNTNSYISDVYEALVAAIYLDKGYGFAEKFIKQTLLNNEEEILAQDVLKDYKTALQEKLQVNGNIDLQYITQQKDDVFESRVNLEGIEVGRGEGKTKKLAEQNAAKNSLKNMVE